MTLTTATVEQCPRCHVLRASLPHGGVVPDLRIQSELRDRDPNAPLRAGSAGIAPADSGVRRGEI